MKIQLKTGIIGSAAVTLAFAGLPPAGAAPPPR